MDVPSINSNLILEFSDDDQDVMVSIPSTPASSPSRTFVTDDSTTSGDAFGYIVKILIIGISAFGYSLMLSELELKIPIIIIITFKIIEKTGFLIKNDVKFI
jgi:hypothetical protein